MGGRGHSQTKIFYFLVDKKTGKRPRAQGKHIEFCLDGSLSTLNNVSLVNLTHKKGAKFA